MLDQCTKKERWSGVNDMIDRWLKERQALIVQYCAVSGVHEYRPKSERSQQRLQRFCQLLVDYVSSGHFEIYYQLLREAEEFEDGSAELAKSLFPYINATTETAIEFNDNYVSNEGDLLDFSTSLSTLGETMAARFELEDRLIEAMHDAHSELVA